MSKNTYSRPPITEAVIGITFASHVSDELLTSVQDRSKANYCRASTFNDFTFEFEIPAKGAANTDIKNSDIKTGYKLSSSDITELLLLRPSSFTISQLAPYPGWETFFARFQRDWKIWKRVVGFHSISRVGVRYINRLDIPINDDERAIVEEANFLNVYPKVPELLSPLEAYAIQARTDRKEIGCKLTLNSAAVPSPILNHVSIVVDQDIARIVEPPQSDEALFELLERIRIEKNNIFEACISDNARALFQR